MHIKDILSISMVRSLYYSARFRGQIVVLRGTRIRLDRGARIRIAPRGRLVLGRQLSGARCAVRINRNGCLIIGGRVAIARGSQIRILDDASIEIGDGTFVSLDTTITAKERITIGRNVSISWNVNILDGNFHDLTIHGVTWPKTTPVEIGDNAWIGTGVTIVGATVGDRAVLGAGSLVTSVVPAKALVSGNPGKVVVENVSWMF